VEELESRKQELTDLRYSHEGALRDLTRKHEAADASLALAERCELTVMVMMMMMMMMMMMVIMMVIMMVMVMVMVMVMMMMMMMMIFHIDRGRACACSELRELRAQSRELGSAKFALEKETSQLQLRVAALEQQVRGVARAIEGLTIITVLIIF
jgi:hypothetical protein